MLPTTLQAARSTTLGVASEIDLRLPVNLLLLRPFFEKGKSKSRSFEWSRIYIHRQVEILGYF